MVFQRGGAGLLLRGPTGSLTHDPNCCCPSCAAFCDTGTSPASVSVTVTGNTNDFCTDCADIDGEIEHAFVECINVAGAWNFYFESYIKGCDYAGDPDPVNDPTPWCVNPPNTRFWKRRLQMNWYHTDNLPYVVGDLRALYWVEMGNCDGQPRAIEWEWDNAVNVPVVGPTTDCKALLAQSNFGTASLIVSNLNYCSTVAVPTITGFTVQ